MELSIPINRSTFINDLNRIGKIGFLVLSFLLIEAIHRDYVYTSLNLIQELLGIRDIRTVRKYILILEKEGYIETNCNLSNINKNYLIKLNLTYKGNAIKGNNFELINTNCFYKLEENSWALYCLLNIYFNESLGYAYPSYQRLISDLGFSAKTLKSSLYILESHNIIYSNKPKWYLVLDENNQEKWNKETNKYYIYNRSK